MENGKRKNIYIVIFIITTIIAGSLAVYFGMMLNNKQQELDKQIASVKESTSNENTNNVAENNVQVKEVEKIVEKYNIPEVNVNKCINSRNDGGVYTYFVKSSLANLNIEINADKKSVNFSFNTDDIKSMYNVNRTPKNGGNYEVININNFGKEVIDVHIDNLGGQSVGYEVALFLMEDGTVEYMPIWHALKNNSIKSYGKIDNVKDIVKLATGGISYKDVGGSHKMPIAIKADGSFYDLFNILMNTKYFDINW